MDAAMEVVMTHALLEFNRGTEQQRDPAVTVCIPDKEDLLNEYYLQHELCIKRPKPEHMPVCSSRWLHAGGQPAVSSSARLPEAPAPSRRACTKFVCQGARKG
jgi:hypothetical protein